MDMEWNEKHSYKYLCKSSHFHIDTSSSKGALASAKRLKQNLMRSFSSSLRKTVGVVWRHGPEPFPCCVFLFFGAPLSELMHMQKTLSCTGNLEKLFLQPGVQAVVGATSPGRPAKPK